MLINPSETCDLSERTIRRAVCQAPRRREVPRPTQSYYKNLVETHTQFSTRMFTNIHNSRRDHIYTYNILVEHTHLVLASRRDMCYNHIVITQSRRALCTTTMISTIHTATITGRISTSIQMISTRIMHETGKTTKRLHIDIMHDII